jgi:hypothetical protein
MHKVLTGIVLGTLLITCAVLVLVGPAASEEKEMQRMYVGVDKCKMCHKSAAQGEQYGIWLKSPHAKAYEALAGDQAKAIAKERGIKDPQAASECLKCHVTAHGVDAKYLGDKYKITDGVGCESCHGPGGDYNKFSTMKAIASGETEPASVGLILPDEKLCVKCHNKESPTFKEFDFAKMYAKIAHPIPAERKAKYKSAAE